MLDRTQKKFWTQRVNALRTLDPPMAQKMEHLSHDPNAGNPQVGSSSYCVCMSATDGQVHLRGLSLMGGS